MRVGESDLPRTVEGHLAVEPRDQDGFVGFDETNGAQLPDSVVSAWVDVRLSGEDISEPILHDCTVGVESVHSEGDTGGDVVSVDLVGVVGGHCTIPLKSNGSIDGESFRKTLLSEMSQSIWVSAKHWHSILQYVAEYFPRKWKFAGGASSMCPEISVRVLGGTFIEDTEFLSVDGSVNELSVPHVILEKCCGTFHLEQLKS